MADELDIDLDALDNQENLNQVNRTEQRIKDLSSKVRMTAEERDELKQAKEALEQEKVSLSKEVDFFKNFSQMTSKYPGAAEYQDQIMEKVKAGYDVEDATISLLAKEGKYSPVTTPVQRENPAGGSATTTMRSDGEKSISEMTQEERRNALMQMEQEGGEISRILRL